VNTGFEKRLNVAWLVLSAMTVTQLAIGSLDGRGAFEPNAAITASAIVIALVKVRIIFREFMDVRQAPLWLCRLTDLWIGLAGVSLLGCYFAGRAFSRG